MPGASSAIGTTQRGRGLGGHGWGLGKQLAIQARNALTMELYPQSMLADKTAERGARQDPPATSCGRRHNIMHAERICVQPACPGAPPSPPIFLIGGVWGAFQE